MPSTDSRERKAPVAWAGVGLVMLAGVGATVGLLVAGGTGIALGAAVGAALGLLLGAIADRWIQRR